MGAPNFVFKMIRIVSNDCGQLVSSVKRALLIAFILLIATLYYKSLFNRKDPLRVFHENSPEGLIFDQLNYEFSEMRFDDNSGNHNESGKE